MRDKLYQKYLNKEINSKKEGIGFHLSFSDFQKLMEDVGITVDDLHIKGYHLSRYNDSGDYRMGNCRFVDYRVNYAEKKISDKARETARQNLKTFKDSQSFQDRSIIAKKIVETKRKNGTAFFPNPTNITTSLTPNEIQRRIEHINKSDKSRGWVCRVAKELGISHTQLRRFINKYNQSVV